MAPAVLSMQVAVSTSDPVRGITTAVVNGLLFVIRRGPVNIEVLDANDRPIAAVMAAMRGGAVWEGTECVARYEFDDARGYSVRPVSAGAAESEVVRAHPLDFLLGRLAARRV